MSLLTQQYKRDEIRRFNSMQDLESIRGLSATGGTRLRLLSGHIGFEIAQKLPFPVHYITLLRDPVARVVSAYEYIRATPEHTHHAQVVSRNLSLQEYIRERSSSINIDNGMTRMLSGEPNNARNIEFGHCTSAMLESAQKNLRERVTLVGLTEHFDTSVVLWSRRFGWASPLYTTKNATARTQAKIEPSDFRLIRQHNELDIELYSYAKKIFRQQLLLALPSILYKVRYFKHKNRVNKQDPAAFRRLQQLEHKRIARWLDLK